MPSKIWPAVLVMSVAKFNPDPARTVYYGNQTWEEMMMPFFAVTVDKQVDPKKVLVGPGPVIGGL